MQTIYFAQCGQNIKIGVAADVEKRLANLRVGSASPINLIASVKGDAHLERKLHARLSEHRISGEWFRDCTAVRIAIDEAIATSDMAPLPTKPGRGPTKFKAVAKALWPNKTEAYLAAIADADVRTARRWLAGECDPPGVVIAAIIVEITKR